MRHAPLLLAAIALTAATATAGDVVRTPRVVSDRTVDCHSVDTMIASIIKPQMSQREKAEAVFRFVRDHSFHWVSMREGDRADNYEYGTVYDPVKFLNVYGYGYCFQTSAVLESLYQAAGLEARGCGIGGHSITEVFYDGGYHYYDADQDGVIYLADGKTVATMDQASRDPFGLVLNQKHPSKPFFPATLAPKVPYESKAIFTGLLASRNNNYTRHDKIQLGHRMDVTLLPGMRYVRMHGPAGKWNCQGSKASIEYQTGYLDPAVGPASFVDDHTYGNGHLLYQPDLTDASNEYPAGVWSDANVVRDSAGLHPDDPRKRAVAIFRIALPYVIVGAPDHADDGNVKLVGAAVLAARLKRGDAKDSQAIHVSTDDGQTWAELWKATGVGADELRIDLSPHVIGQYRYLLKVEMASPEAPAGCRLQRIGMRTNFQCNPATVPAVGPGRTKMTFTLGEQTETVEHFPDLMTAEGLVRDAWEIRNIRFTPGRLRSRGGEYGELIYMLEPPQPGTISSFRASVGCRREPGDNRHLDDVKVYYAINEPTDWRLLEDDDVPPYAQHWSYWLNGAVACEPDVRRVYVKVMVRTHRWAEVQRIGLWTHWLPDGERAGMPQRGVRVEHAWREGCEMKTYSRIVREDSTQYTLDAGEQVENQYLLIEPVREARCEWWDLPDIPAPELAKGQFIDPATRDEMLNALKAIDADPIKGLTAAAKSKIGWLADNAKQALTMYRNRDRYPLAEVNDFGRGILARAGTLIGGKSAAGGDDVIALLKALETSTDAREKATLAAALVLVGDARGRKPLADAIARVEAGAAIEELAVLLKSGDPAAGKKAADIMLSEDEYLKLRFLAQVRDAELDRTPEQLLVGLTDDCRWVRLAVLEQLRAAPSPSARPLLVKMSTDDPLGFLRAEAVSVLGAKQ